MLGEHFDSVVLSVNAGRPRVVELDGRAVRTAIWKRPVAGRVRVRDAGVGGDQQADRSAHGGPDKAVYAYAREDLLWWEEQLGRTLEVGAFGENLTTRGVDVSGALVGERWAIGSALLEVRQPRIPCAKLGLRIGDPLFPGRFGRAGRPGAYLGVLREGEVGAGDVVRVLERPSHGVTVALAAAIYLHEHERAGELLAAPALPEGLRGWVAKRIAGAQK